METLDRLPRVVRNRIASDATKAAARELQGYARNNINIITGKGRRSVKVRKAKRTKDRTAHEVYSDYKTLSPEGYYTAFLEYGWTTSTGRFVDEYKWLSPAFDDNLYSLVNTMHRVAEEGLRKAASQEGGGAHGRGRTGERTASRRAS